MIDLTPLFQAVIMLAAVLVTTYVIPWIKSKTTTEQQNNLLTLVNIGVYAAEKIYGAGKGDEKLAYVNELLSRHNIKIDTETLAELVNSEIKKMEQLELKDDTLVLADGDET